jgi:hypothetical protein
MYNVTSRSVRAIIVAMEKQQVWYECVFVALAIQNAMGMLHIVFVDCPTLQRSSILSDKRQE